MEKFQYEKADRLCSEIEKSMEDDVFAEDKKVLKCYLDSLYQMREEGIESYQQFLKDLPENYDGILSEQLWKDHNKL